MENQPDPSPRWSSTTKLVVGLTFIAILAVLILNFTFIVGPLLMAFILSYLLFPVVAGLTRLIKIPWRLGVGFIFLIILVILSGLLTWGGIALIEQIQNLVQFLQTTLTNIPVYIDQLSKSALVIGPFTWDLRHLDLNVLGNQILNAVQPLLSQMGSILTSIAGGAASTFGWILFVLLVSFFILSEIEGEPERLIDIKVPGYSEDFRRLGRQLGLIWNAFLRGQLTITVLWICVYSVVLGTFGLSYFFGLAILAGFARFIPYIGPGITWTTFGLVAYFQGSTIFGLTPIVYVLVVVGSALVIDNLLDSLVTPRLIADALKVHPAAVMVAALVAANILGIIGIMLAAPVLATAKLFVDYTLSKLFDLDPWTQIKTLPPPKPLPRFVEGLKLIWVGFFKKFRKK
jgi:predicted PurR-regulated permease PerM